MKRQGSLLNKNYVVYCHLASYLNVKSTNVTKTIKYVTQQIMIDLNEYIMYAQTNNDS